MKGKIQFFTEESIQYRIKHKQILKNWLSASIASEGFTSGDISIILCSDLELLEMNKQYLNHDYYTDVITFDYTAEKLVSGDLYISLDRILENAKKRRLKTEDELHRIFVHGVLHLCGYQDKSKTHKEKMTQKEDEYLRKLPF